MIRPGDGVSRLAGALVLPLTPGEPGAVLAVSTANGAATAAAATFDPSLTAPSAPGTTTG